MHSLIDPPHERLAFFHSRTGGFSLHLCSYTLLDADCNDTGDLHRVAVVRVTAYSGERHYLRDRSDIRRFLVAVGRIDEVEL